MTQRLDERGRGRGEWDCVRCGVRVGVKGNPLDASDPRPLCYDCAVRERDGREHAQRTREAAARGVPAALRELAHMEEYEAIRMLSRTERGNELLTIVRQLTEARTRLDALAVGDSSGIPNVLKRTLDAPIEQIRAYARQLYMGDTPSRLDTPNGGEYPK